MDRQQIIMSYSTPPSAEELGVIAQNAIESLPEEILEFCEDLAIVVEDIPDETLEQELELDDPYDLIALFRSGRQISPGVERKVANEDDILVIFRRPLLDMWCETGDDLSLIIRQVMIEELAQNFDFSDEEIDEMSRRHFQGLL